MAFTRSTLRFLRDLDAHNDTAWFHDHKQEYERHVREPALHLIEAWAKHLPSHYIGHARKVGGALSPPNRDIRFARDKRPYRSHVAIRFRHRLGLPGAPTPTFLLWLDPGGSFLSAGVRNVSGESRRRIVESIAADPDSWQQARVGLELCQDDLFATPKEPDLRLRHYSTEVPLPQRVATGELVPWLRRESRRLLPLNEFLAEALYGERASR